MSPQEAGIVLATLLAGFPEMALEPESVQLWTQEIAGMGDFEIADYVARGFVRETDRFPTLHAFREGVQRANREAAQERARTTGLPEPRPKGIPEWVQVWWWIRHSREPREERSLPQMAGPNDPADAFMRQDEYDALLEEWRAAGSPSISLSTITGDIAERVA